MNLQQMDSWNFGGFNTDLNSLYPPQRIHGTDLVYLPTLRISSCELEIPESLRNIGSQNPSCLEGPPWFLRAILIP